MTYYDNNFYVLVMVTNATPDNNGSAGWKSDCVDLYFAMVTANANDYREGDWLIRKLTSKSKTNGGIHGKVNLTTLLDDPNFKVEKQDDITYIQEWLLPVNTLVGNVAFNDQRFRFDIQVAENDGSGNGKTTQLFWNSNANDQKNKIQHQGFVKLECKIIDEIEPISVQSVNRSALIHIKPNSIGFSNTVKEIKIYNFAGQVVLQTKHVQIISTTTLKKGIYLVEADNEKAKFVIR